MGCNGSVTIAGSTGANFMTREDYNPVASEKAVEWLEARGLDSEVADRMGWHGVMRDGEPWLAIPFIVDGNVLTTQFRKLSAKEFRFAAGSEVELWNVDCLKNEPGEYLVIAEGALDGLALVQSGYRRTVGVPGWSEQKAVGDHYKPFQRHEAAIRASKTIIVAQDADPTGAAMLRAVNNMFDEADVRYVTWPAGCKDANDALQAGGVDAVVNAVTNATLLDPPGGAITTFSNLPPLAERQVWKLGLDFMDKVMAFRTREVSVLTGTPGSGKTTFMTWACYHLARQNGIRIGLALLESDPKEVGAHLRHLDSRMDLDKHFRVLHRVDEAPDISHDLLWLRTMIHKAVTRDGCNMVVIDPWNEVDHFPERGETMTNYINLALMRLRQWAEKYDIHICLTAHPKKMTGNDKPMGYDVADSAAFFNKPGMGWTIHEHPANKEFYRHLTLTNWKTRSRESTGCRPGVRRMQFDEHAMIYRQYDPRKPKED